MPDRPSSPPRRDPPARPAAAWLMPAIVGVAVAVVIAGVVWASVLGHLF